MRSGNEHRRVHHAHAAVIDEDAAIPLLPFEQGIDLHEFGNGRFERRVVRRKRRKRRQMPFPAVLAARCKDRVVQRDHLSRLLRRRAVGHGKHVRRRLYAVALREPFVEQTIARLHVRDQHVVALRKLGKQDRKDGILLPGQKRMLLFHAPVERPAARGERGHVRIGRGIGEQQRRKRKKLRA